MHILFKFDNFFVSDIRYNQTLFFYLCMSFIEHVGYLSSHFLLFIYIIFRHSSFKFHASFIVDDFNSVSIFSFISIYFDFYCYFPMFTDYFPLLLSFPIAFSDISAASLIIANLLFIYSLSFSLFHKINNLFLH